MNASSPSREIIRVRVAVVGDAQCGKTALLKSYEKKNLFLKEYRQTLLSELVISSVIMDDKTEVELYLLEAAGSPLYSSKRAALLQGFHIVLALFDITSRTSYTAALAQAAAHVKLCKNAFRFGVLVGCKADRLIDAAMTEEEMKEGASQLKFDFALTSAATQQGVKECFHMIAQRHIDTLDGNQNDSNNNQQQNQPKQQFQRDNSHDSDDDDSDGD